METQTRLDVLNCSLVFEHMTSQILGDLLEIDFHESNTLGSKSSALSFKSKVDLIVDIRGIDKEDAKKFLYFAEIRNQFMHNLEVDTFTRCFKNLGGTDNKLKKLYPLDDQANLTEEQVLNKCFNSLFLDINKSIGKLLEKVRDKYVGLGMLRGSKLFGELLVESMNEIAREFPDKKTLTDEILRRANEKFDKEKGNI